VKWPEMLRITGKHLAGTDAVLEMDCLGDFQEMRGGVGQGRESRSGGWVCI